MARFPRRARLLRPPEFERVFKNGQRDTTAHYAAVSLVNEMGHARLGLALSRKQAARAVDRNRLKRQIRAGFREHQDRLPACDIVVMTRAHADRQPRTVMAAELDKLWSRIARRWSASSSSLSGSTSG